MFKRNRVFLIIMVIALLVASLVSFERMQIEGNNKTVDIIIDYDEMVKLAGQSENDLTWYFNEFKEMGISKVGLPEESLKSIASNNDNVEIEIMDTIINNKAWKNYPTEVKAKFEGYDIYDLMVVVNDNETFINIKKNLEMRYAETKIRTFKTEETGYILVNGNINDTLFDQTKTLIGGDNKGFTQIDTIVSSKLVYISLGLDIEKVELIEAAGLTVVPRTYGYNGWNDEKFEKATIEGYSVLNNEFDYLIFAGKEVIGEDSGSDLIKKYVKENNLSIGIIETTTQRGNIEMSGILNLVEENDYNTTRMFTVWPYIQSRYQYYNYPSIEEIENTFFRAVTERNIRAIYFKPIKYKDNNYAYVTDIGEYKKLFDRFENRISEHGMTIGRASVMDSYKISIAKKVLITLGAISGVMILLQEILLIKKKYLYGLFGLTAIGAIGAFVINSRIAELLASLGSSLVFSLLAILYMVNRGKYYQKKIDKDEKLIKILGIGMKELLITSLIAFAGAISTTTLISDISFMLEIDIFRGVKIAQLLPIAAFFVIYLAYFGFNTENKSNNKIELKDISKMFTATIKIWMVIVAGIVMIAGYIYIARTGHETSVAPLGIELIFRNFLEETLYARPRNKEFLIAFPALMLFIYTLIRSIKVLPIVFALAAVIGQTSIINTFMHIRTPMYLSIARTGYSIVFGIILGIVYIALLELLMKIIDRIRRELLNV